MKSGTRSLSRGESMGRAQGWGRTRRSEDDREALWLELRVHKSQVVEETVRARSSPTGPGPTDEGLCPE